MQKIECMARVIVNEQLMVEGEPCSPLARPIILELPFGTLAFHSYRDARAMFGSFGPFNNMDDGLRYVIQGLFDELGFPNEWPY
jgi:hypothetical protein